MSRTSSQVLVFVALVLALNVVRMMVAPRSTAGGAAAGGMDAGVSLCVWRVT